mmetsp:Transcript_7397/g.16231  ORF Transcript_7397/g.16231 Transcript_7397/m.16231 type:complete len:960 (+) Transcript_7397:101-2980(+)
MSASARLKYTIVRCSSEDPEYPSSELLTHSPDTKGWQSARFCDFPQELGLQFETPVHLRQVQFLSHQSKIATKIELYTALPAPGQNQRYETAQFKRLGYFSLDNNERSQFQARELKSVYVDVSVQFLRIMLHKCHVNRFNIVNQVGLVAVNCLGEGLGPDLAVGPPAPNPALVQRDGRGGNAPAAIPPRPCPGLNPAEPAPFAEAAEEAAQAAADELQFDPRTLERLRTLEKAKQRAVESEDYDEAKRLKDMLSRLRRAGQLIRDLEERKKAAVQNEDFDAAKSLKVEIDRLRAAVDKPVQAERPPSGGNYAPSEPAVSVHQEAVSNGMPWAQMDAMSQQRSDHSVPSGQSSYGGADRAPRGGHQPVMAPVMSGGNASEDSTSPHGHGHGPLGRASPRQAPFTGGGSRSPGARSPAVSEDRGSRHKSSHKEDSGAPYHSAVHQPEAQASFRSAAADSMGYPNSPRGRPAIPETVTNPRQQQQHEAGQLFERSRSSSTPTGSNRADHPLQGVPNVDDLPNPEALNPGVEKDAEPITTMFGEYIARCIFSKTWNLRDAALQKLALDLREDVHSDKDAGDLLRAYAAVLRITLADKNVQVFLASAGLLQAVRQRLASTWSSRRPEAQAALDPLLPLLVERLGDANARVEKTTRDALLDFSQCLAAPYVVHHLLRPLKKKNVHSRVFVSRLQLMTALTTEAGVQPEHKDGVPLEPTVQLAMEWFASPAAEVRENSVKLVGACYRHVGLSRIEKHLASLRPAQREVFDAEFDKVGKSVAPPPASGGNRPCSCGAAPSPQNGIAHVRNGASVCPPAGAAPAPAPAPAARKPAVAEVPPAVPEEPEDGEEEEDDFTCQFCGRVDDAFTPEGLDLHYFTECPMLKMCELCQQVIEIPTLKLHLEEECEGGEEAAALAAEMHPTRCPLCNADLGSADDAAWRRHLLVDGCPENPRDAERQLAQPKNIK